MKLWLYNQADNAYNKIKDDFIMYLNNDTDIRYLKTSNNLDDNYEYEELLHKRKLLLKRANQDKVSLRYMIKFTAFVYHRQTIYEYMYDEDLNNQDSIIIPNECSPAKVNYKNFKRYINKNNINLSDETKKKLLLCHKKYPNLLLRILK